MQQEALHDVFRNRFPETRAWTHEGSGLNEDKVKRRLDNFMTDSQLATHPATRTGIEKDKSANATSDHNMVILDIPLDCALAAKEPTPVWDSTKVTKRKLLIPAKTDPSQTHTQERRAAIEEANEALQATATWTSTPPHRMHTQLHQINTAMEKGGVTVKKVEIYPRPVRTLKGLNAEHYSLRTWGKNLNKAAQAIRRHGHSDDPARALTRFNAVAGALKNITIPEAALHKKYSALEIETERITQILPENIENAPILMSAGEVEQLLLKHRNKVTSLLNKIMQAETAKTIRAKTKAREENFEKGHTKATLRSVFHTHQRRDELEWARRPDGTLVESEEELGTFIADNKKAWFSSVVPIESRWDPEGTKQSAWEALMNLDTSKMNKKEINIGSQGKPTWLTDETLVKEVYIEPGLMHRAKQEGWWDGVHSDPITLEETKQAIKDTSKGTAPGKSQTVIDEIAHLNDDNLAPIVTMFDHFRKSRRIPDEINNALVRLLPKTAAGLSDLDKTRPIALMETITKLYERIIIGRVTERLMKFKVLDKSQYGAVPKAGTFPPRKVLQAVMEDANITGNEMHLLCLDLKKAFDTCEYWSQALSWRAFGAPDELIKLRTAHFITSQQLLHRASRVG